MDVPESGQGFPDEVADVLERAGWSPERSVDISGYVQALESEGYTVFPKVREFLASFGGLDLRWQKTDTLAPGWRVSHEETMEFDAERVARREAAEHAQAVSQHVGRPLCAIGTTEMGNVTVLMSPAGEVYACWDEDVWFYGATPEEGISNFILHKDDILKLDDLPLDE